MTKRYFWTLGAIALAAGIAGVYVGQNVGRSVAPPPPALDSGTAFPAPRALADFSLVDTHGAPASPASLRGHPTLVFFGFTNCPDVCPTTLAVLAGAQKKAAVPGLRIALISVDPERDTPELLGKYVASFGNEFIGLTGDAPGIVKATRTFGVASSRVDLPGGGYTMDHSATVFALDSDARIVAVFTPPLRAEALARDLETLKPLLAGPTS
jgi:protein SCO1/2